MPTLRTTKVDLIKNDEALEINLDLIEEKREQAAIQKSKSKAKMEKYYNSKVHSTSFNPGDMVYRSNDASHAKDGGKVGPKWEGPYEVTESLGKGAYKLKDRKGNELPRMWNICFVDSDYAKDPDKAEYMALTEALKEAIWLRGLLEELGVELNTVAVNCDNQGAIHLSRNHVFHERTTHINVRYHFIREVLEAKTVKVLKVGTEHNAADALTKVVPGRKLQHCLELLKVGVG
ncbi:hypothetical protein Tco_0885445 [Tanacetum coccineum]